MKILQPQFSSMLAEATGKTKKQTDAFLKAFFTTITASLEEHENVKVKGFGTFKINRVEARKSVNISNGEEVRIPAHYKIVFTPSPEMAENVNREFSWLEVMEITSDEFDNRNDTASEADNFSDSDDSEELGEELEREFGNPEPVEPFGPIDPDDPEPGTPEPENVASPDSSNPVIAAPPVISASDTVMSITSDFPAISIAAPTLTAPPSLQSPQKPVETQVKSPEPTPEPEPAPEAIAPVAPVQEPLPEPEPQPEAETAIPEPKPERPVPLIASISQMDDEPAPEYATVTDLKVVRRNVKRVKLYAEEVNRKSKRRSISVFIWSLVCSAALIACACFLVYNMFLYDVPFGNKNNGTEQVEGAANQPKESPSDVVAEETASAAAVATKGNEAPTAPSDIKAVDKVTNSRYLTTMAKEHYGNYNFWTYIYLENEEKLGHPDRIKPGTQVVIPSAEKYGIDANDPKSIEKAKKLGVDIYKKFSN